MISLDAAGLEAVRKQLEQVLADPAFSGAPRVSSLLRYVVEETLAGRGDQLKEYTLGSRSWVAAPGARWRSACLHVPSATHAFCLMVQCLRAARENFPFDAAFAENIETETESAAQNRALLEALYWKPWAPSELSSKLKLLDAGGMAALFSGRPAVSSRVTSFR
ncbi:MAG: hypothetical protein ACJ746_09195 [Bryobacteraceae bacterium]